MQILLTGANGFIGRHLAQRLDASPHTTCGLIRPGSVLGTLSDLPRLERRLGDVLSPESLVAACEGVDVVVHLAGAVAAGRDATYHRVNVEGAARNIVAFNAGLAIYAGNKADSIEQALTLAFEIIANGSARAKLEEFCAYTRKFLK